VPVDALVTFDDGTELTPDDEVTVTADSEGKISGTLRSSNVATQKVTLEAEVTVNSETSSDEETVTFAFGEQTLEYPDPVTELDPFVVTVTRTFDYDPLDGHHQLFWVSKVTTADGTVISAPRGNEENTKPYAVVLKSPPVSTTDGAGKATLKIVVLSGKEVDKIEISTRDGTVYDPTAK
jgi:hypothetical protein